MVTKRALTGVGVTSVVMYFIFPQVFFFSDVLIKANKTFSA